MFAARFRAMGSPCEVLVDSSYGQRARTAAEAAAACAGRIERKFSRYRTDSVVAHINAAAGRTIAVDAETARLIDYAAAAWQLSGGKFDLTSGVLRRAWHFDGGEHLPMPAQVRALLPLVGWHRVTWQRPHLTMPAGMEIDFGGIGKEYAVDLALAVARELTDDPVLVNFGGDLAVSGPRRDGQPWHVGVESAAHPLDRPSASRLIALEQGALATSGDTHRFIRDGGTRRPHILDPRSGEPVRGAPHSVTVAAATCSQAGLWCTLAMLEGAGAEALLSREQVPHWIER